MDLFSDDLLLVVVTYTTTKVTVSLLGTFTPMRAYDPHVWKLKTLKESLGLVFDDDVVAGQWYPYYLHQNRTYYGDAVIYRAEKLVERTEERIIYYHNYYYLGEDREYIEAAVVQRDDYTVWIDDVEVSGFPPRRRLRDVRTDPGDDYAIVLVDEYGYTWGHDRGHGDVFPLPYDDVAAIVWHPDKSLLYLQRGGAVLGGEETLEKVAHASYSHDGDITYITVEGEGKSVDPFWNAIPRKRLNMRERLGGRSSAPVGAFLNSLMLFEEVFVKQRLAPPHPLRIVKKRDSVYTKTVDTHAIMMTTDRTAYLTTKQGLVPLADTRGRTQYIEMEHYDAYAILDPLPL